VDRLLVERVMALVDETVARVRASSAETGVGSEPDICDLGVTRSFAEAMLSEGVAPEDLACVGQILMLTSDVMNHHQPSVVFETFADEYAWSYSSLGIRMFALAFVDCASRADDSGSADGPPAMPAPAGAIEALARSVDSDAIERLAHSISRALINVAQIDDHAPSPYAERGRAALADSQLGDVGEFSSGG
jgi:hypothetical protein